MRLNNKYINIVITMMIIIVMVSSSTLSIKAADENHFETEAKYLHDLGVFAGKNSNYFDPALVDGLTRQEGMKLLADIFSWNVVANSKSGFSDVTSWAEPYVKVAVDRGVTQGVGGGKFGGQDPVTYAQFYTWILRELGETDIYSSNINLWFNHVQTLAENKKIFFDEITDGAVPINRDYAVGILFNVLPLSPQDDTASFFDKIIENIEPIVTSIVPENSFIKNSETQVLVKDSKKLVITIANYTGNPTLVDVAMCGKNLCNIMASTISKGSGDGEFIVTLPSELEAGVPYYISSIILTDESGVTNIVDINSSDFTVVNDETDKSGSLIMIESREELDNYVAFSKKPVSIDFYANWCGPCVALAPIYAEAATILSGEVLMLKVNIDVISTSGFEVLSIPNQQFYEDGEKAGEYIGYRERTGEEYADLVRGYFVK